MPKEADGNYLNETRARLLLLWAFWLVSTLSWSVLSLSLLLGRTTPLTVSRWWILGLAGILVAGLAVRLSLVAVLQRALAGATLAFGAHGRAALADLPLLCTLPLLASIYLSDSMFHYVNSYPILKWSVALLPIAAAAVMHEAILNLSLPHGITALFKVPRLSPRIRALLQESIPVAILIGLALAFFWPIFTGQVPIPADLMYRSPPWNSAIESLPAINNPLPSDAIWQSYPSMSFRHWAASSALIPLWNPYVFAGLPFLAEPNSQVLQPFHLFFALLPPSISIAIIMPLYMTLAGASMYAFLRVIAIPRGAALVGAITFMFCSFVTLWLQLVYLNASVFWLLPLCLIGAELLFRGCYRLGALISSLALSLALIGNSQIAVYIMFAFGLYAAWLLASQLAQRQWETRKLITQVGVFTGSAILAVSIAAAQLLPSWELVQLSERSASSSILEVDKLLLPHLLAILLPGIMGYPPAGTAWGNVHLLDLTLYVGVLPLTLACWAAWSGKSRYLAGGLILTLAAFLLALAWPSPEFIATIFPPYRLLLQMSRALILAQFGLALLAALGVAAVLEPARQGRIISVRLLISIFLFAIAVAAFLFATQQWPDPASPSHPRAIVALWDSLRWLIAMALASGIAILLVYRWGRHIPYSGVAILCAVVVLDLAGFAVPLYTYAPSSTLFPTTPVITYLKQQHETHSFRVMGLPRTTLTPNAAMVYGLHDARGYSSLLSLRNWQYASVVNGRNPDQTERPPGNTARVDYTLNDIRLLSLINVEFILIDKQHRPTPPLDLSKLDYVMESAGTRGVVLYRNPNVFPRAFLVGNAETVSDSLAAAKRLQDPQFDPAQQVVLENPTALPTYSSARVSAVEITTYESETVRLLVNADAPAWLVLTDAYYPGWQATINGEEVPIYPANVLFRAVAVPAGSSNIEFSYRPASWRWGALISLAALFGWLTILFFPLRRTIKWRPT